MNTPPAIRSLVQNAWVISLMLVLLVCEKLVAQHLTPFVGVQASDIQASDHYAEAHTEPRPGFHLGLSYEQPIHPVWNVEVGLSYQQKGYAYIVLPVHGIYNDIAVTGHNQVRYHYAQAEALLRLAPWKKPQGAGWSFSGGLYLARGVSAHQEWSLLFDRSGLFRRSGSQDLSFRREAAYQPDTTLPTARPWDVGFQIGMGYEWRSVRCVLGVHQGLSNIQPRMRGLPDGISLRKTNVSYVFRLAFPISLDEQEPSNFPAGGAGRSTETFRP